MVQAAKEWAHWYDQGRFGMPGSEKRHRYGEAIDALAAAVDALDAANAGALPPAVEGCVCSTTAHDTSGGWKYELNADADCPIHGEGATANLSVTGRGLAMHAVLSDIIEERFRQDAEHGGQDHPDGTGQPWPLKVMANVAQTAAHLARISCKRETKDGKTTWLGIALEEVAEAFAETEPGPLRTELLHAAAVFVAWIEALDRRTAPAVSGGTAHDGGEK